MKRLLASLALLALAPPGIRDAQAREGSPGAGHAMRGYANPSAAIAAELAFARLAQEKGQWSAFKATAAEDAVMFTPAMVLAKQWLHDRPDPSVPLAWQPHRVWASCDGSLMITTGAWQRSGRHGWFTTVWQRQEDGLYKWVLDHSDETSEPLAAPDMIAARIADCPERRAGPRPSPPPDKVRGKSSRREKAPPVPFDPARRDGRSSDGTLTWRVTIDAAGTRDFTALLRKSGEMEEIRNEHVTGG